MTSNTLDMSTIAPLSEHWVLTNNRPIFYRAALDASPPGSTPIIHIHGFGMSGRYLVPTAERLAPHFPTYVPDLPGYGRSPRPSHPLSIPELALEIIAFMDALGIERAHLLGNSMGCLIAIECALQFPHRVDHAILVSPAGGAHNQPLPRGIAQLAVDSMRESLGLLRLAVPDYFRFGPLNSIRLFRSMTVYATSDRALNLEVPSLVILGARDPLVSRSSLQRLVDQHPQMTMVIQDKAAHAINFSHPRSLAEVAQAWLSDERILAPSSDQPHTMVPGDYPDSR